MKFSDLKNLIEEGKLKEFQDQLDRQELVAADYNLLLRQIIRNKSKKIAPIFQKLITKGADVNFTHIGGNKKSNLMVACQQGTIQALQLLVAHPKIDYDLQDSMKKTAPFYAIQNKNKNDAEVFLEKILKHAPHLINKPANNQSMLICAIKRQRPQLVRILLNHRAEPNYVISDSGNTPLHEALKMCKTKQTKANKDIVKLLIEYGADPQIKNKKDKNVFQFADKFPLQNLISQIKLKPKGQQQKVQEQNKKQSQSLNKQKQQNKKENIEVSKKSQSKQYKKQKSKQNWQSTSPLNKQKSKKQINKNKEYSGRQNKQQKDQRQNRQNQKQNHKTLFSLNTQQEINNIIKKADYIYDNQMKQKQLSQKSLNKKKDNLISQDQSISQDQQSYYTESSDQQDGQSNAVPASYRKKQQFVSQLSQQIKQFQKKCDDYFHHTQKQFQKFYHKLCQIGYHQNIDIQLYGSFSTGLWCKHCDIDLLLMPRDQFIAQKNPNYVQYILDRFQMLLKKQQSIKVNNIMRNKKARVPLLRIDAQLPHNNKSRKIDLTIYDRTHNGINIAHYINQNLKVFPQLKPLFFVIKSLTFHFKLYDPKLGGIRTYAIIIMILSFLQNQRMKGTILQQVQIGQLLLRFLYFFGFQYQYQYGFGASTEIKPQIETIKLQPTLLLTIYDPLNHANNLGKNTKAYELQSMFKAAFIALHSNVRQGKLQFMFGLKKIYTF